MKEKRSRRPFLLVAVALVLLVFLAAMFSVPQAPTEHVEEPLKAEAFLQ